MLTIKDAGVIENKTKVWTSTYSLDIVLHSKSVQNLQEKSPSCSFFHVRKELDVLVF
jgi:hypothetical protein